MTIGPPIEALTRRLLAAPPVVLDPAALDLVAVVADLLRDLSGDPLLRPDAVSIVAPGAGRSFWNRPPAHPTPGNRARLVALTAYLLHDAAFFDPGLTDAATALFTVGLDDLAATVDAGLCVTDADRREELARTVLEALGLLPEGETAEQAADRLATVSSSDRARVVRETRAAEERARAVLEAIRRKAAEDAAAKAMRE